MSRKKQPDEMENNKNHSQVEKADPQESEAEALKEENQRIKQILDALYRLSEAGFTSVDLDELFQRIHEIVNEFMTADNFYIALYDRNRDMIHFPYFKDRYDQPPEPKKPGKGLTEYVLKTGKSLLATTPVFEQLLREGKIELIGAPSIDWLGVPLKDKKRTIGIIAVQNYSRETNLGIEEQRILEFVAQLVATAIERKQAELKLKESEKKYREILDHSLVGIYIIQENLLKFCNQKFSEIFGYQGIDEILDIDIKKLVAPESWSLVNGEIEARESGSKKSAHYQFKGIKKDGTLLDLEVLGSRIEYQDKPAIQGTIIDLTERKRMEKTLIESEMKFRNLIEQSPISIEIFTKDGLLISANKAWEKLWNQKRETAINKYNVFKNERIKEMGILPLIKKVFKGQPVNLPEVEFAPPDNPDRKRHLRTYHYPIKNSKGEIQNIVVLNEDITERKRAEDTIKDIVSGGYARYGREFFEMMARQLARSLKADYTFIGEATGSTPETIRTLSFYADGEKRENFEYSLDDTPCKGVLGKKICSFPSGVYRIFPRNQLLQSTRAEGYVGVPLSDSQQNPIGIIVALFKEELKEIKFTESILHIFAARTAGEIERKQLEEKRERLEEQLRHSQKMEALGTLAGGIAHDFNNILSAIFGYTELAMYTVPEDSKARVNLEQILAASYRARDMVKQILTFSRKEKKGQISVFLDKLVVEVLKLIKSFIPSTIELQTDIVKATRPIQADPTQIHQVIMNICTNALQAMRETGGILKISLKEVDIDPDEVESTDLVPGKHQLLTITDTGSGISPDIMSLIFDPYFTTKEKGEGTGLGLAVVHGIVNAHRGTITVESAPGEGTAFLIHLPTIANEKILENEGVQAIMGGDEWILFVDDEVVLTEVVQKTLARYNYNVITRTSAAEALEVFRSDPEKIDVVITDHIMPQLTGLELAKEIKKIRPDIPVLLCTGLPERIDKANFNSQGIDGYILKPIISSEMKEAIHHVLKGKREKIEKHLI